MAARGREDEEWKIRQIKMGSNLDEEEVKEYSDLVEEFSDTFVWSYDELKGIPREMVEHRIPLIPGARPIRQTERVNGILVNILRKTVLDSKWV